MVSLVRNLKPLYLVRLSTINDGVALYEEPELIYGSFKISEAPVRLLEQGIEPLETYEVFFNDEFGEMISANDLCYFKKTPPIEHNKLQNGIADANFAIVSTPIRVFNGFTAVIQARSGKKNAKTKRR